MEANTRKRLQVVILGVFVIELYGLYLAWPHIGSFLSFVTDLITGLVTYVSGIIAAIVAFKLLVLAKLLISLLGFMLSFLLKMLIALLPEASARFLIKLGIYSGVVRLYEKSEYVRSKWEHFSNKGKSWFRKIWKGKALVFWRTVPKPEKIIICLLGGPLIVLPMILLWVYDWIRLFVIKKTGVLGLENLIKKAHKSELHKKLYGKAIERLKRVQTEDEPA